MFHSVVAVCVMSLIASLSFMNKFTIIISFLQINLENYLNIPAELLVGSLWGRPLILRDMCDSLKFLVDFRCQIRFLEIIIKFLIDIDTIDSLSLILVFHKQEGIVVRLIGVEVHLLRLIYFKIFVHFFTNFLFLQ